MLTQTDVDIPRLWRDYRAEPTVELRNQLDELISAGVFGLMDAIEAFDLDRGVKFETYCVPRIRGAMLDELRTMDWVPRLVRSKASRMEESRKSLEAALGRPPRPDEMAEKLGVSLQEFDRMAGDATA